MSSSYPVIMKTPDKVSYAALLSALKTGIDRGYAPEDREYVLDLAHSLRRGVVQDVVDMPAGQAGIAGGDTNFNFFLKNYQAS